MSNDYELSEEDFEWHHIGPILYCKCDRVQKNTLKLDNGVFVDPKIININNVSVVCNSDGSKDLKKLYVTVGIGDGLNIFNVQSFWKAYLEAAQDVYSKSDISSLNIKEVSQLTSSKNLLDEDK
jgi:hypothetical protein